METLLTLLSALALLVWGSQNVQKGVMRAYGEALRRGLARCVTQRYTAFLGGALCTCLTQSSNATAMMANSFVASGALRLEGALAIALGADAGSALMARVLTLDLRWLGPLLLCLGVWLFTAKKATRAGHVGRTFAGLGIMLLALHLIVTTAEPIFQANVARAALAALTADVGLNVILGALLAMLSYSSLAAVLLTATLSAAGAISLDAALQLSVGATIGSGVLGVLSSAAGASRQAALGNLLFKAVGGLLVLPAIPLVATYSNAWGFPPLQTVVNFHVVWNLARTLLELHLIGPLAHTVRRYFPIPLHANEWSPKFLDETALETPALALGNSAQEALRVADMVEAMLAGVPNLLGDQGTPEQAKDLRALDDHIDELYAAIKMHLSRISQAGLTPQDSARWASIMEWTIRLEQMGDILYRIIGNLVTKKITKNLSFSTEGHQELQQLCNETQHSMRLAMMVFLSGDLRGANELLERKTVFRKLEEQFSRTHLDRLARQGRQSVETSALHLDLLVDFKRLHSLICSIAYTVLKGEEQPTAVLSHMEADALRTEKIEPPRA